MTRRPSATPAEFAAVRRKCDTFRNAIRLCGENAVGDPGFGWTRRFPRECCDHASKLLFILLYQSGCRGISYVRADCGDDGLHVWLQWKDLIIDITADQFPEFDSYVLTPNSVWHDSQRIVERTFASHGSSELEAYENLIGEFPFDDWYEGIMAFWNE